MPHFQAPDGTGLFYRDWGAGRPVVFVHGMLMSSEMWRYQAIHLTYRKEPKADANGNGLSLWAHAKGDLRDHNVVDVYFVLEQ